MQKLTELPLWPILIRDPKRSCDESKFAEISVQLSIVDAVLKSVSQQIIENENLIADQF
jgi:hypothetical protein